MLWQIGQPDGANAEFALAPKDYVQFANDGFFVVGLSDPKLDWPYAHPGPSDSWAGSCAHTFAVAFGLKEAAAGGTCLLRLNLLDTHYKSPPRLKIDINGRHFEHVLPPSPRDGSIAGHLEFGKPYEVRIEFPAAVLKEGRNDVAITNDNGSWFLYDAVALETPPATVLAPLAGGEALLAKARQPLKPVDQIVVVFKTHFDIGYTDLACNVVQRYRTSMIDQALDVVAQNRDLPAAQQFAWTIPGWPMSQILDWPEQTPERKARVEQALREGRFVVHALPFTTHTELLELEDLVRGLGYASRITRRLGLPLPRDAKMTDVPEHTWAMATLLHHAGVEFMHIGCNAMSYSPQVPPLYWWEGPDGSRLLTMYSPNYGTGLFPPRDWPYKTWLALLHTGDNHGPPRPEEVKRVLDQIAKRFPTTKVRIGRLSDFAGAIRAENPDLPVVRGDTPDSWIHGPMSDPAGASMARHTRSELATAEALGTGLRAWGVAVPGADPRAIPAAYEKSLLYGEHTWGGSIGWIGKEHSMSFGEAFWADRAAGRFARSEASWEEHSDYIRQAVGLVTPLLDGSLQALARSTAGNGERVIVYNPLPWKRDGVVSGRDGKPAAFLARDVPAMGYRVYNLAEAAGAQANSEIKIDESAAAIETPFFRAQFDPSHGTLRSLADKSSGRELVEANGEYGFGQFLYERFDADQVLNYCHDYIKLPGRLHPDFYKPGQPPADQAPYSSASPKDYQLRFVRSGEGVAAEMSADGAGPLPKKVVTRFLFRTDQPCVDLEIRLEGKPLEPWPEAGWLCLPFRVDSPQFRLGRLGSIVDPAKDLIRGANHDLFGINTGVVIADPQGRGAGFCSLDSPLVSLDRPGCWKFTSGFVPKQPIAFVNLFNNQWNTNFRLWNGGTWTYRVRIWAVDSGDVERTLVNPSLEARFPLVAVTAKGPGGALPPFQRGLELSRKGVQVTAFGDNPDGEGTVLRLWELAGQSGPCEVALPEGLSSSAAQPVNLRGEPVGPAIPLSGGKFIAGLHAFAPASFVFSSSIPKQEHPKS